VDGAHNPAGARALAASLSEWFDARPLTLIFGALRDKDIAGMLGPLSTGAARIILAASSSPRAAEPRALAALVAPGAATVEIAGSAADALALAARPPRTPILCIAGSLTLVGDVFRLALGGDKPCSIEKGADSMESLF
jgi:dihydrofolate synthase / folylpolyglutamate synthase